MSPRPNLTPRTGHPSMNVGSAALIPDGKVLLIEALSRLMYSSGGILSVGIQGAEIYDPSTGVITATGSVIKAQTAESAAELYDPAANAFKLTDGLTDPYCFYGGKPSPRSGRPPARSYRMKRCCRRAARERTTIPGMSIHCQTGRHTIPAGTSQLTRTWRRFAFTTPQLPCRTGRFWSPEA